MIEEIEELRAELDAVLLIDCLKSPKSTVLNEGPIKRLRPGLPNVGGSTVSDGFIAKIAMASR